MAQIDRHDEAEVTLIDPRARIPSFFHAATSHYGAWQSCRNC
jgi:hypothetical protein